MIQAKEKRRGQRKDWSEWKRQKKRGGKVFER